MAGTPNQKTTIAPWWPSAAVSGTALVSIMTMLRWSVQIRKRWWAGRLSRSAVVSGRASQSRRFPAESSGRVLTKESKNALAAKNPLLAAPGWFTGNNVNLDEETLSNVDTGLRYQLALRAMDGKFGLIPGDDKEFIPLPEDKK